MQGVPSRGGRPRPATEEEAVQLIDDLKESIFEAERRKVDTRSARDLLYDLERNREITRGSRGPKREFSHIFFRTKRSI